VKETSLVKKKILDSTCEVSIQFSTGRKRDGAVIEAHDAVPREPGLLKSIDADE
jgi:hypothetical protein